MKSMARQLLGMKIKNDYEIEVCLTQYCTKGCHFCYQGRDSSSEIETQTILNSINRTIDVITSYSIHYTKLYDLVWKNTK